MGCAGRVGVPAKNIVRILKGNFLGDFLQDFFFFWPLVLLPFYLDTTNTNRKEREIERIERFFLMHSTRNAILYRSALWLGGRPSVLFVGTREVCVPGLVSRLGVGSRKVGGCFVFQQQVLGASR